MRQECQLQIKALKWDTTEAYSDNFEIITKYYDLGSSSLMKTIYSISVTCGMGETGYTSAMPTSFSLFFRTSINKPWSTYASFYIQPVTGSGDWTSHLESLTIIKKNKLKLIPGIQLKLRGHSIPEGFLLNDIAIEYRHIRKKGVGRPE